MISVIVPIFNVAKFLDECISSIVNQTYKNIEIILVDDGSTDNSPEICEKWKAKDSRIKVIHKENGGLSDARNCGIENSTGDYLVFIDSDDVINLKMIEILYEDLKKYNSDIAVCKYKKFFDSIPSEKDKNITIDCYSNKLYECMYGKNGDYAIVAWNKIYKKNLFDNIRYPYKKIHEDEFIIHRLLSKSKSIVFDSRILYYYRQRSNSITSSFNIKRLDALEALEERLKFYKENKKAYDLTYKSYMFRLAVLYKIADSKDIKNLIKNKQEENIKYAKNSSLTLKNKMLIYLSVYTPNIFNFLYEHRK